MVRGAIPRALLSATHFLILVYLVARDGRVERSAGLAFDAHAP
jgi:hypothetical protein